jgi:hypothetical protein
MVRRALEQLEGQHNESTSIKIAIEVDKERHGSNYYIILSLSDAFDTLSIIHDYSCCRINSAASTASMTARRQTPKDRS